MGAEAHNLGIFTARDTGDTPTKVGPVIKSIARKIREKDYRKIGRGYYYKGTDSFKVDKK